MKRKNGRFLRIIALMCTVLLSFQSLLPVYRAPGKRPARYTGPKRARQTPVTPIQPIAPATPTAPEQEIKPADIPKEMREEKEAKEHTIEQVEPETEKEAGQLPAPTGFFSKAYTFALPLILITLNEAMGIAIAEGTKNAIESFLTRRRFMNMLSNAENKATELVKTGKFDKEAINSFEKTVDAYKLEQNDPRYKLLALDTKELLDLSPEVKKDLKTRQFLAEQKIKDPDAMIKTTSYSSIGMETLATILITMAANAVAKIFGYSITASLQTMMPEKG